MNTRIEPSRLLCDPIESRQLDYVNAASQTTRGVLATWGKWRADHAQPMTADRYQQDAIDEKATEAA